MFFFLAIACTIFIMLYREWVVMLRASDNDYILAPRCFVGIYLCLSSWSYKVFITGRDEEVMRRIGSGGARSFHSFFV